MSVITRPLAAVALVCLLSSTALIAGAQPASAAERTESDATGLAAALADPATTLVVLGADILDAGALATAASVTIDLHGQNLTSGTVVVATGTTLTITDTSAASTGVLTATGGELQAGIRITGAALAIDSGTVYAYAGAAPAAGGRGSAGIGGNGGSPSSARAGGQLTVTGGSVFAYGTLGTNLSTGGAGIGGAGSGAGGTTVITAGVVEAHGGNGAAGIGGGASATGVSTTISGGTVRAWGGFRGAGIGGGEFRYGGTITITAGTVEAYGGSGGAGIGSGYYASGSGTGTIAISGGTVQANGNSTSAGIGGGYMTSNGPIIISGGDVTARSNGVGAGIGSGQTASAGPVTISGGTVVADGGTRGSGIGTGLESNYGSTLSIGAGATVTASGSTAIGSSESGTFAHLGTVTIDGTLIANSPIYIRPVNSPSSITVGATGRITGTGTITGYLSDPATIANSGSITNPLVNVGVSGNNYLVTFDANGSGATVAPPVRIYASSFAAAGVAFPADPTRPGYIFVGWNTHADSTGDVVSATSTLTDSVTAYALFVDGRLVVSAADTTLVAGESTALSAVLYASQTSIILASTGFSYTAPSGAVTGSSVRFTTAGTHTVTATLDSDPTISDTIDIDVSADQAHPASLDLQLSATTVNQGGSLTFAVTGEDAYGNSLGDLSSVVTVTSDISTDVIDGTTITFPHASPHVITASYLGASASVTVEVVPAASSMANTGVEPGAAALSMIALLVAGAALLVVRRRHSSATR